MKTLPLGLLLMSGVCAVWAQTRLIVYPRDVVNACRQLPAALVARGGIVQVNGLNLGPPLGLKPSGTPLPTRLGDVQVLINGKPAPLFSVDIRTNVAQVPVDAAVGTAELVVGRATGTSPPVHFIIQALNPCIRTAYGSGCGLPWGTLSGKTPAVSGTGLGAADPAPIDAFIGGMRTNATAAVSTARAGEFDNQLDVPAGAQPGDLMSLFPDSRPANLTTYQTMSALVVVRIP